MRVIPIPAPDERYSYLVVDEAKKTAAAVDPFDADTVADAAEGAGAALAQVLVTDAESLDPETLEALVRRHRVRVHGKGIGTVANRVEAVEPGDPVHVGGLRGEVIATPSPNRNCVSWLFSASGVLFCGDSFSAGGRGAPADAQSVGAVMDVIDALPPSLRIYGGRERSVRNLEWALDLEPMNRTIDDKLAWARARRGDGRSTVPTTLEIERRTNPFFRLDQPELLFQLRERFPEVGEDRVSRLEALCRWVGEDEAATCSG